MLQSILEKAEKPGELTARVRSLSAYYYEAEDKIFGKQENSLGPNRTN